MYTHTKIENHGKREYRGREGTSQKIYVNVMRQSQKAEKEVKQKNPTNQPTIQIVGKEDRKKLNGIDIYQNISLSFQKIYPHIHIYICTSVVKLRYSGVCLKWKISLMSIEIIYPILYTIFLQIFIEFLSIDGGGIRRANMTNIPN